MHAPFRAQHILFALAADVLLARPQLPTQPHAPSAALLLVANALQHALKAQQDPATAQHPPKAQRAASPAQLQPAQEPQPLPKRLLVKTIVLILVVLDKQLRLETSMLVHGFAEHALCAALTLARQLSPAVQPHMAGSALFVHLRTCFIRRRRCCCPTRSRSRSRRRGRVRSTTCSCSTPMCSTPSSCCVCCPTRIPPLSARRPVPL